MNTDELVESYVADVTQRLPMKQRNDVAHELRALLNEELQAKADAAGRDANEVMALELLRAFGRPADVAARYLPSLTVIDPADGRSFLRASVIGVLLLWTLGVFEAVVGYRESIDSGFEVLRLVGKGWGGALLSSLWWPGLLVVCYGVAAWVRRRWPHTGEWQPRAVERDQASRLGLVLGVVGIACALFVLIDPRWLLDLLFRGRAAPEAYEAFTYTQSFRDRQAMWLFLLIAVNVPLLVVVTMNGRWTIVTRQIDIALSLVTSAVMVWAILDGPVLVAPRADRFVKFCFAMIVVFALIDVAVKLYRGLWPEPVSADR